MTWPPPVTLRNSVVPLPRTSSQFQYRQIQNRNFQLDEVWVAEKVWPEVSIFLLQNDRITILAPSDTLHSPPVEETASRSRSSQYFPPTRLSYYSSSSGHPVYPFIGPVLPSVPAYLPPSPHYYQAPNQPDTLQDRVDAASLSVVSLLPSILKSVVVPVLAAGSAVWLSQNLPTPVVQERKKRSSGGPPGGPGI